MQLEITQEDIDKGKQGDCGLCPIALAIRRKLPKSNPLVLSNRVFITDEHSKNKQYYFRMSSNAQEFICEFDNGFPVKPIEIELTKLIF